MLSNFRARSALAVLLAGFLAVIAPSTTRADALPSQYVPITPIAVPPFVFKDAHGQTVTVQDFRGRYVLLNIWATWCAPCVEEMPSLNRLQAHFPVSKLQIVALNEDHDGAVLARAFYTQHSLRYLDVFVDEAGRAPALFSLHGLPTTFLIDPRGNVIGMAEGNVEWDTPDSIAFLEKRVQP